jgi:hypothetical protein
VREFLSRHAVTVVPSIAAARKERVSTSFDVVWLTTISTMEGDEFVRELRAAGERIVVLGYRRMMRATPRCAGRRVGHLQQDAV